MDLVDKSLLFELERNCRIAFTELSNLLNIPVDEVGSRTQQLVRDHIILKFTVVPQPILFGAKQAISFFRSSKPINLARINSLGIHPTVEFLSIGQNIEGFALMHYRTLSELFSVVKYFQKVGSFEDIRAFQVQPLRAQKKPTKDIYTLQDIDWLILCHLREQGRLSLTDLSTRTNIAVETLVERLQYMRDNHLIQETIHINPAKTAKETWTIFSLKLTIFTEPLHEELSRELEALPSYWRANTWRVEEKPILLLGFLCSSYNEVEKIQNWLSETPGLISIEKIMGGVTYYFPDFRDELLEEKRSADWFKPEEWVNKKS